MFLVQGKTIIDDNLNRINKNNINRNNNNNNNINNNNYNNSSSLFLTAFKIYAVITVINLTRKIHHHFKYALV